MLITAHKSRCPLTRRVRYDGVVTDENGRMLFSVGFFRGLNAKARALQAAADYRARKLATGSWTEPRP